MTPASPRGDSHTHTLVHVHMQLHTHTLTCAPPDPIPVFFMDVCDSHKRGHQSFVKWWLTRVFMLVHSPPVLSDPTYASVSPPITRHLGSLLALPWACVGWGQALHQVLQVPSTRRTCPRGDRLDLALFLCRQVTVLGLISLEFRVPQALLVLPGLSPPSGVRLSTTQSWQAWS